jgi:hypothetical protein
MIALGRRFFSSTSATTGNRHPLDNKFKYKIIPQYPFAKLPEPLRQDLWRTVQPFAINQPSYRSRLSEQMPRFTRDNPNLRSERLRKCERNAAILVPMCMVRRRSADGRTVTPFEPGFLFTVRSQNLRKHAGEVR